MRDLKCTQERLAAARAGGGASGRPAGSSGQAYTQLFVRHWDTWSNGTRSHLFVARLQSDGRAATPVDVSKSLDATCRRSPLAAMRSSISARTASASCSRRASPLAANRGRRTFDLFEASVDGGEPANLTQSNPAADTQPVFLRNGDLPILPRIDRALSPIAFILTCAMRAPEKRVRSPPPGIAPSCALASQPMARVSLQRPRTAARKHCSPSTPRTVSHTRSSARVRSVGTPQPRTRCTSHGRTLPPRQTSTSPPSQAGHHGV